jgi:hypothetical protein
MRRIVLLAALFPSPALADEPAAPGEELFPLALGNSWTYKVGGQDDRFIVRAAKLEMVGGQTCFLLEARLRDKVVATEHLAFTKEGLCRFKVDKEEVQPPVCVLQLPAAKATKWEKTYQLGGRSATANFSASASEVTVPAGKYKTVNVVADMNGGPMRLTTISYADGVGPVKQIINEGKRTLVLELEKFERGDGK